MAKKIKRVVEGAGSPPTNDMWLDNSGESPVLKTYVNGEWVVLGGASGGDNPPPSPDMSSGDLILEAKTLIEGTFGFYFDENDDGNWVGPAYPYEPEEGENTVILGNLETADYGIWAGDDDNGWYLIYVTADELKTIEDITDVDKCQVMWIDLGLPSGTLWADRNMGAYTPEDFGNYYYASVTEPVGEEYTVYMPSYLQGSNSAFYRAPSWECFEELIAGTTHEEVQVEGVTGVRLNSKTNQNSIFIPYCGNYNAGAPESSPATDSAWLRTSTPSGGYLEYFTAYMEGSSLTLGYSVSYWENACPIRQCIAGTFVTE